MIIKEFILKWNIRVILGIAKKEVLWKSLAVQSMVKINSIAENVNERYQKSQVDIVHMCLIHIKGIH